MSGTGAPVATCILGPRNGGGKTILGIVPEYTSDCKGMQFNAVGNQLYYDMAYNWGMSYNEPAGWVKSEFDYELRLSISFKDTQTGKITPYYPRISSVVNDTGATETIKPLYIMYGCLEENTLIKMSDDTSKKIQEIEIGNEIMGADGEAWMVKNVWRGTEEELLVLSVGDKLIGLTHNHPLKVNGAAVPASALTVGMKVQMENGEYEEIISISKKVYNGNVFNLDMAPKDSAKENVIKNHYMIANGFVVGDNVLQNDLEA